MIVLFDEFVVGVGSVVIDDVWCCFVCLFDDEICECMSGNLCWCGVYLNIVVVVCVVYVVYG